jgi:hypothetical protein
MRLAEALLERKSVKVKIDSLQERLDQNALVQEGDTPAETAETLMAELRDALATLETLIRQINAANNVAKLPNGTTVSDAIVRRDMLKLERLALERVAATLSMRQHRYGRNEVKFVATVGPAQLHKEIDRLSKEWRELDAQIQAVNWQTDVTTN